VKTVILCGGKGTRIRDVSDVLPKPMISIGEYPIVEHIMDIYSYHNFNEFVLCLGYMGWKIKEYFLNYRAQTADLALDFTRGGEVQILDNEPPPWKIILAQTGLEAMTGSRIKRIQKYIGNETFMLTYGDGVGDLDVTALLKFHKSHGKLATITSVRPPSRFGELVVSGNVVESFEEKPQTVGGLINGGFFVCEPGVFDYVTDDDSCVWEREPLQNLSRHGQLMTYFHQGFWMPMDTLREYQLLNELWKKGQAPWNPRHKQHQLATEI
jgi:glucose-1-phosphate cytidylyltransferase